MCVMVVTNDEGWIGMQTAVDLWNWLLTLDASFAFLLALPFVVGAAALLAEWVRARRLNP